VTSTGVVGTVVTGDIGIFPGSAITGFPPAVLNGAVDSANGASGGAQGALTTAYNMAAGLAFNTTLSNQDLGGMTLLPGVYKFDSAAAMNGMLTLDADGNPNAVWVFQIGSSFLVGGGSSVIFKDSIGNPDYVYWQVGTSATLANGVAMVGNIFALASIVVNNGATVQGRCLARNAAVTLDKSVITMPVAQVFVAEQTVEGISVTQFNADEETNTMVMKEAISTSMIGVSSSNIEEFTVEAGPTTTKTTTTTRSSSSSSSAITAAATVSTSSVKSILMKYKVVARTMFTAEQLQYQLKAAVLVGTFNTNLQSAATNNGATDLQSAISGPIATQTITEGDDDSSSGSNDKKKLSDGAIAGIVIGCVCFALLMAAMVAYWAFGVCGGSDSSGASKAGSASVPTQEEGVMMA
jgi:hypothetical protein